ncbi:MAG: hypothetical protein K6C36_09650 [Clostridia bacterium]|nr:hypothetical protein [Clostridia bacterium]
MNKKFQKLLALTLSLVMALGVFSVSFTAFADDAETVPEDDSDYGVLVIGDSIGRGCGAEGFYLDRDGNPLPEGENGGQYDEFDMRNVQGSYATQIGEALGCEMPYLMTDQTGNFWPLCYPGMTTTMMIDLMGIEDDYDDVSLNYTNYDWMLAYFGSPEYSKDGVRDDDTKAAVIRDFGSLGQVGAVDSLVKRSSLIVVELGMCDIFYRAYRKAMGGAMFADGLNFDFSDPSALIELIQIAIEQMNFGQEYFETWYPKMIEKLIEWNPDAKILLVGAFNLVNQLRITDNDAIPLGSIISVITDKMNKNYKKWAKQFGDNVYYVDVANTEPLLAENDWSLLGDFLDNSFAAVHPSQEGHDYMARQIMNVLTPVDHGKNIVIDLGRYHNVDYVWVNDVKVFDYTMEGSILTIPCKTILVNRVTVGTVSDSGVKSMQVYRMTYSISDGYSAYRVYGANDMKDTIDKNRFLYRLLKLIYDKIVAFFRSIIGG